MKIYTEQSLRNFEFWSGAKYTAEKLTDSEFDEIENAFEEIYPDGMSETLVNDIFWFDEDFIAETLGYENWEELERSKEE